MDTQVDRPRVSVVIPAHNASETIARAIASVQAQTPPPDEILVVDDASTDDTAAIAEKLGARTIRLLVHAGAAAARNAGIAAATGEIIAFQDADDEWLPDKFLRQLPLLADASFVACGARLFDEQGKDLGPLYDGEIPREGTETWRGLLARNTVATPCVVAWRHELLAAGGFDPALPVAEDQDFWIRLALHGRLRYVDLFLVRVHRTKKSVSGVGTALGARQQIEFTLPMVERHIAANRARLSAAEIREIRGGRKLRVGRGACWTGAWAAGAPLVLSAMLLGYRPLEGFRILAATAPPIRWLRARWPRRCFGK
jgi:glycosyltransferase involved in cell wall biosynthesis